MPIAAPACFLNLDLVLKARSDLRKLIECFEDKAFVVAHEEYDGEFTLVLELTAENLSQDPQDYTRRFLAIITEFPDEVRDIWKSCSSRIFSYGFDGGANSPALDVTISADLLFQVAQVRADIAITVYPFREA
jgi:hypothetical protein